MNTSVPKFNYIITIRQGNLSLKIIGQTIAYGVC
jgi:hypothetical protein